MSERALIHYRGWPVTADDHGFSWEHGGPFETEAEVRGDIDARPADDPEEPACKYLVFKTVANLPDRTGMYRVSFCAASDFAYESPTGEPHVWSDEAAAETSKRRDLPTTAIHCDKLFWQAAFKGALNGYAATSDVDAQVTLQPWSI